MSEVLYRKYRPQKFSEVIGQDNIVKILDSQAKSGEISHAYLFAGTRGTGKTSVARIFAKSIGTDQDDIYEIDAASNTSVDDIRTLNESVGILPFKSKYKVYILDEAHMLSKSASNALLKTLEEPPAHVIFILATTETHKIPDTIKSRCEVYIFKKPNIEILKKVVLSVVKKEGFSVKESSAELIALLGDGSFRDTLGIVQKIISYSKDKNISEEEVRLVTGAPAEEIVEEIILSIGKKDLQSGLTAIKKVVEENVDMSIFLKLILRSIRAIMFAKFGIFSSIKDDFGDKESEFISKIAKEYDKSFSSNTLYLLLDAYERIGSSYIPSLPIELALVEIIRQNSN